MAKKDKTALSSYGVRELVTAEYRSLQKWDLVYSIQATPLYFHRIDEDIPGYWCIKADHTGHCYQHLYTKRPYPYQQGVKKEKRPYTSHTKGLAVSADEGQLLNGAAVLLAEHLTNLEDDLWRHPERIDYRHLAKEEQPDFSSGGLKIQVDESMKHLRCDPNEPLMADKKTRDTFFEQLDGQIKYFNDTIVPVDPPDFAAMKAKAELIGTGRAHEIDQKLTLPRYSYFDAGRVGSVDNPFYRFDEVDLPFGPAKKDEVPTGDLPNAIWLTHELIRRKESGE